MTMKVVRKAAIAAIVAGVTLALSAFAVACGGGDDDGDDGGNGGNGAQPTAVATEDSNGDNGDDGNGDGGEGNEVTLVSKNTLFDKSELEATAGEVTIIHDNQDGGIIHNVHVYKGSDADGEDKGMTELEAGPVVQELELTLDEGEHFYVCDSHPATMSGTLTVTGG
jgi:plastocyanin